MKWDVLQGDIIKHIYAGSRGYGYFYNENNHTDEIQLISPYIVFRVPMFFCYIAFPPMYKMNVDIIHDYWKNTVAVSPLIGRRVELIKNRPVQIFENAETGEEIKVDTRLYSKYIEKADQLTFWGTDYRSPVFGINGDSPDRENIVFMVLPIV